MKIIVTGGAGFIGTHVLKALLSQVYVSRVLNIDVLTYAGNLKSFIHLGNSEKYSHKKIDISDANSISTVLKQFQPDAIMHLAAESHVDRSISGPKEFLRTNINGTYVLLEEVRKYLQDKPRQFKKKFRFHHVSTDEVYGTLGEDGVFTEETAYDPRSPYSASKAASDHLVRAWHHTYGINVVITNCSNNYGPYQYPEKLIPVVISNALEGMPIPIYGTGQNVRDWLYVEDHVSGLLVALKDGLTGATYNIGGNNERKNIEIVRAICEELDDQCPSINSYSNLITYIEDRPGHDQRYAVDATKIKNDLGWSPRTSFEEGIKKTVTWYIENKKWWRPLQKNQHK